ncbi:MAG: trigger factor [Eubacterium sp.]|jgi:trigger factor|nr:trigger factor [Eubacterium sp.]
MSFTVEQLENNRAKLTITVPAEDFGKALVAAYNKQKGKINISGFRKGKVPMAIIEKMYGPEIFYDEAANKVINETYPEAYDECELDIVSRPEIDVTQIEKGKDFIYTATVDLKPEVKLGTYKGIEVEKVDTTVSGLEVDEEIDRVRRQNARKIDVTDRAAKDGDITNIDFEGFVDGEAFEGGKGESYTLKLGSKSFIPGFEDQIVGHEIGEEFDVNVTFPEDYHSEDLKGKAAVFKCKLNSLQEEQLPELDDEYVSDISDVETVDEYKDSIRKQLEEKKEKQAKTKIENAAIEKLMETSEMDIPASMIEGQQESMLNEFKQQLSMQGMSFDMYSQYTGLNEETMLEQVKPEAEKRVKSRLVLEAVSKAENIEVSDEDVDKKLEEMAAMYGIEADKFKGYIGDKEKESIKKDIAVEKAADFIVANIKEV